MNLEDLDGPARRYRLRMYAVSAIAVLALSLCGWLAYELHKANDTMNLQAYIIDARLDTIAVIRSAAFHNALDDLMMEALRTRGSVVAVDSVLRVRADD